MRRIIPLILFLLFFLIGVFSAPSIGASWDEPDNIYAGGVYLNFFTHGFDPKILVSRNQSVYEGRIFSQEEELVRYPPVPLIVGSLFTSLVEKARGPLTGAEIIEAFHIMSAIFLGVLVVFVYEWGILLGLSLPEAIIGGLVTGFLPTIFGHGLSNIKDIAQVALFTASLYGLVRSSFRSNRGWFIFGAVVWGLALASKFNAIYVPIIWGMWGVCGGWWVVGDKLRRKKIGREILSVVGKLGMLGVVGIVTMIVVWPYLWFDPVGRLQGVVSYFTTVGTGYNVLWNGTMTQVGQGRAIWWYPLGYLVLSTPIPILVFSLIGFISLIGTYFRKGKTFGITSILLFWLAIPLFRAFLPNAAFYDGIRHFMEVLPAICLLFMIGTHDLFTANNLQSWHVSKAVAPFLRPVVFFGTLGYLIIICAGYFPYATGYMNALAHQPNEKYDRDFSGLAVKEGMDYLHRTYGTISVFVPIGGHLSWYYVGPNDKFVYTFYDADSIIFINKSSHATKADLDSMVGALFRVDHVIVKGDQIFGWVYRRI